MGSFFSWTLVVTVQDITCTFVHFQFKVMRNLVFYCCPDNPCEVYGVVFNSNRTCLPSIPMTLPFDTAVFPFAYCLSPFNKICFLATNTGTPCRQISPQFGNAPCQICSQRHTCITDSTQAPPNA